MSQNAKAEKTGLSVSDINSLMASVYGKYNTANGTESGTLENIPLSDALPIIEPTWDMLPPQVQANILRAILQYAPRHVQ